jgi:hypothetical protein
MTPLTDIERLNSELADQINQDALADPNSPYAGKYVGIANGRVVAVAEKLRDVASELRRIEPDPARTFIVEASRDYSIADGVWGLR